MPRTWPSSAWPSASTWTRRRLLPHDVGQLSWRVDLLRIGGGKEGQTLQKKFHLDEPWDSLHNKDLITEIPFIYQDPAPAKRRGDLLHGRQRRRLRFRPWQAEGEADEP